MHFSFCTTDFEGPLDLLLHLVKESKMDIYEINVHDIIEQYLAFIRQEQERNIDIASEYLVMASELIHLKSKLLINRKDEEEIVDDEFTITSEEDLKNKLLEYEKYKELTKEFTKLESKRNEVYTKLPENFANYFDNEKLAKGAYEIEDLFNAYMSYIKREKIKEPLNTKITKKEFSVEDKIKDIRNILSKRSRINFIELFKEPTKSSIVVTFLSILEMCKKDEINLTQEDNFSPIMIEKRV